MTSPLSRLLCLACCAAAALALLPGAAAVSAEKADGPKFAHMVFFALKDHSPEVRDKFVASCHKYLSGHEGTVFFAIGTSAEDVDEPGVSVHDFDVSLHLVFDNKGAGAKYLKDPRHLKFVEENKALFGKVRVFDSYVTQQP